MARLIDADRALEIVREQGMSHPNAYHLTTYAALILKGAPTVDAVEVVHGRWIKDNNSLQTDDYYCCYFDYNCSECGNVVNDRHELPKYCPNCGARMDALSE